MESQTKELGCLLDFWSWDWVSLEEEHRRSETELKMMNSIFIVEFGVPVTHSVENFYSYIYPVLWNSATEVRQGEGKII